MPYTSKDHRFRSVALSAAFILVLSTDPAFATEASGEARRLMETGENSGAIILLKNALQQDPGDMASRLLLGQTYLRTRDGAAAEKELRRAAELGADPASWRFELVQALLLQRKSSDALERLKSYGEEDLTLEDRARSLALQGKANLDLNQEDDAERLFAEALGLEPGNVDAAVGKILLAMRNDRLDEAAAAADHLLEQAPDHVEALLARGQLHLQSGETSEAAGRFARAMELAPADVRAILSHAKALVAVGDFEAARADLDRADEIQKGLALAEYLRGAIAFEERDWERARRHLLQSRDAMPNNATSQLMLGIASYQLGELEAAEESLRRVVTSGQGTAEAGKFLAATRIRLGEPQGAIEVLEPIVRRQEPPNPEIMALLGTAYRRAGDPDKAREWLQRSLEVSPDFAAGRTQLALTLLAGGETGQAITELETAAKLRKGVHEADTLLILAQIKNNELDKALEASRALEARMPDSPIAANLTGLALLAQGDEQGAWNGFSKALTLDPGFVNATINLANMDVANGNLDFAQRRYESVLASQPRHLGAMLDLAALAQRRGDTAAMVSWLEKASEANPDDPRPNLLLANHYILTQEALKAQSAASRLAARFPEAPRVLEVQGRANLMAADFSAATRALERLVKLEPGRPRLWYLLGLAELGAEDLFGARAAFAKAVELEPGFLDAQVAIARVELEAERFDSALAIAEGLQRDHPEQAVGYALEGSVRMSQDRPDEAVPPLEKAYDKRADGETLRQLVLAYDQADRRGDAIALLEDRTGQHPYDGNALLLLAKVYQEDGRRGPLRKTYEALAALDPDNAVVLNNLALQYQAAGDPRAVETARRAYELDPERPETADTLGWILLQSGEVSEGLPLLQEAYTRLHTDGEIGFHVAVALRRANRTEESARLLKRLLRTDPDFPQAAEARALLQEITQ